MGVPDRLSMSMSMCTSVVHFCDAMMAPHLLRAGGTNSMNDCLEKERNKEACIHRGQPGGFGFGEVVRCTAGSLRLWVPAVLSDFGLLTLPF